MLATTDLQSPRPQVPSSSWYYCWGSAIQEVEVCGGEHSSACLTSEAQIAELFGATVAILCSSGSLLRSGTTGLSMTARITPTLLCGDLY